VNWLVFAITAWVGFGLETGLKDSLAIGSTGMAPSFVIPLAVYVAMNAPTRHALWAALVIGLVLDLTWAVGLRDQPRAVTIVGPYALGMLLAATLVLQVRGVVNRRNPLTLMILTVLASVACHVVVSAMLGVRAVYDPIAWSPVSQLASRMGMSLYTGVGALAISFVLIPLTPAFAFSQPHNWTIRRS
jgi:cell shape-determining protein MreD